MASRGNQHCANRQWRSNALRGPGSTVTWGPSVASAPRAEAGSPNCWERGEALESLACSLGLGSDVNSPSVVPSRQRCWCSLCSQMTSAVKNPACTVQVCHFTYFALIFVAPLRAARSSGPPVHWTHWTPGFYATANCIGTLSFPATTVSVHRLICGDVHVVEVIPDWRIWRKLRIWYWNHLNLKSLGRRDLFMTNFITKVSELQGCTYRPYKITRARFRAGIQWIGQFGRVFV